MNVDRRLLNEAQSAGLYLVLTIGSGLLAGVVIVLQAHYLSLTVSRVFLEGRALTQVQPLLLALLLAILARAALVWIRETAALQAAGRIKALLRERLLARLLEMGPVRARGESTGELVNTAVEGIESLDAYFSQYLPSLALAALIPATILIAVFPIDLLTALVFLLTAPLIPIFMVLIGKAAESLTNRQWDALSRMSAHFLDTLQGLPELKALGRSDAQGRSVRQVSERFRRTTMGVLRVAFLSALVLELMATISTALVAVGVGFRLLYDTISFQQAFFVLILAPEFYQPMRALGASFHAGMSGVSAARRIFALLDRNPVPQRDGESGGLGDGETAHLAPSPYYYVPPSRKGIAIEFRDVSYAYDGGARPALRSVSFQVGAGEKLALVGPTGSGKSTIASLLLRFLEPDAGEILVGGVPLSRIPPDEWRDRLSWVPQHPYLFSATVADNIRLARPRATAEEVVRAAREAGAERFIEQLPQGFDTPAGERGVRLSGGEAQRIALARAFLKDAPILIMDEATSHLDPWQEADLRESIDRLMRGRTVITIAHRLGAARGADLVVVLSEGGVEQAGSPGELLRGGGLFRRLVTAQVGEDLPATTLMAAVDGHRPRTIRDGAEGSPPSAGEELGAGWGGKRLATGGDPPSSPGPSNLSSWSVFQRLLGMLSPLKGWVFLSGLLGVATVASGIGLMSTAAFLLASAALHPSVADLALPVVGVRFFGISRAGFRYLERYVSHDLTFRLLAQWRVWFYQAIEPLAPARLMGHRSGDLLARIVGDVEALQHFYVRVVSPPVVAAAVALLAGTFLAAIDLGLALALILFLVLSGAGVPLLVHRAGARAGAQLTATRARLNAELVDGIQGMADLTAFGRLGQQLERVRASNREWLALEQRVSRLSGLHGALMTGLSNLGMWAVLVTGTTLVAGGSMDGVLLPVVALAALASFEAVAPLPQAIQHLEGSLESARRLFELAEREYETTKTQETPNDTKRQGYGIEPRRHEDTRESLDSPLSLGEAWTGQRAGERGEGRLGGPAETPAPTSHGGSAGASAHSAPRTPHSPTHHSSPITHHPVSLVVEGLTFRYGPGEPLALRDVSFSVPAGGRLALVGPSGGGKSTLINLLLRFWDYREGHLLLAGREISSYPEHELRELVSVVSQRTHLFNTTIRENLIVARPEASEDEMVRAAEAAQLHGFVRSLPRGYDTQAGDQGLRLSGGERQQVAIARAILKDAPVVLLDEPTASLDALTEQRVMESIRTLVEGRTTLVVTHRLSILEATDEILVLEEGRAVERGRQTDLLRQGGLYQKMWEAHHQAALAAGPSNLRA